MYRKGRAEDCQLVYDLICEMEGKKLPYEDFSVIYAEQLENTKRCYLLICELEGKVAGMLNLRFERQLHHAGPIAEIMEFVVDPALRSQGVGSGMFEEACRIAHEAGCSQIEVACNQLRKDTHRFYEREGMKNYHFKFSKMLMGEDGGENKLGR